ncbi:MAG TPA: ATP-binding protein [Saprospiraceae bacterium]|nr:ATP-binding protein [Saprospiraceae bacterium]
MFKNSTPRAIAIYTALILGLFISLVYLLILREGQHLNDYLKAAIIIIAPMFFTYVIISFALERYIYRRIKLIYKTIRRAKVSMPAKAVSLTSDRSILDNVEEEVADWAAMQENEINTLKTLEQYRKRFLGNVAHELKTPIFSIQGFVHTLLDGAIRDEKVNVRYLERAAQNVERLLTIVEDLDTVTKLESGELILEIQEFELKTLVREVFTDLEMKARDQGILMRFKEGADRPFRVRGDREYVRQVLTNLMVNSINYGRESGLTKVSMYDMDKQVLVEISDNGIGIEEKHLKHLFDRFYRVDKSRSRAQGGSGLGLSIVKHILEAHGQSINVRSTPGVGSTFGFTLDKA